MTEAVVLEVLAALEDRGIAVSVAGGWAVHALLGRVTREYGDLDLSVDAADIDRAVEALSALLRAARHRPR